ncbi:sensor histidine kinase [Lachnoclostridium phytofermentans]|uniref:histidine kinase n=1 Tax=Lachnoclostridium phytofermentans (strain ATCC 700394 / DSM 18823 / ISDg) TaxID=357809 RepID=A9KSV4_LACP7|nr:HAMP domain-containing sensor histidine kinase [Lachnoclostridium phytofermentans]ABX40748.1 histidine kinase [Lachnoclostridium phytofermentans ISDg]
MTWIIVIALCIAVGYFIAVLQYKKQIRTWNQNLSFILSNNSNMRLEQLVPSKDVSKLLDLLNELMQRHRKLKVEYEVKDEAFKQLITNLSHDIRTPLTSLDGYFQLLTKAKEPEVREHYITIIEGRIRQLSEMLDQLFLYMKLQNDCYELSIEKCNLSQILCECILDFYEQFTNRGIEPVIHLPEEEMIMLGNPSALIRILQNMIKNALEHGNEHFQITLEKEEEIVVTCKNGYANGEEVDFSLIFERFYKADKARTRSSTGLGLAIAKELTEKLGGSIEAINEGTEFLIKVHFPVG